MIPMLSVTSWIYLAVFLVLAVVTQTRMLRSRHTPSIPSFRATTAHACILYPFQMCTAQQSAGVLIGHDVATGNPFSFGPFQAYLEDKVNPNIAVIGTIGSGKSSLLKTMISRHAAVKVKAVYIDPKGESEALVAALDGGPDDPQRSMRVQLVPGGEACLNPFDAPVTEHGDLAAQGIANIIGAKLNRPLSEVEQAALTVAVAATRRAKPEPILSDIHHSLLHPLEEDTIRLGFRPEQMTDASLEMATAVWNLCDGPLGGMFDGKTTFEVNWQARLIAFDLSAIQNDDLATRIVMAAVASWVQPILRQRDGQKRLMVVDEAWHLLTNVTLARWIQANYKLSRQFGISNVMAIHRVSDLRSANVSAEATSIAFGLLVDSGTKIIYRQETEQLDMIQDTFKLNDAELAAVRFMRPHTGLWKVGGTTPLVVAHQITAAELEMVDTDEEMREVAA